jgi:hypothetical protein
VNYQCWLRSAAKSVLNEVVNRAGWRAMSSFEAPLPGVEEIRSGMTSLVEVVDFNVGRKRSRRDSVAAWLAD